MSANDPIYKFDDDDEDDFVEFSDSSEENGEGSHSARPPLRSAPAPAPAPVSTPFFKATSPREIPSSTSKEVKSLSSSSSSSSQSSPSSSSFINHSSFTGGISPGGPSTTDVSKSNPDNSPSSTAASSDSLSSTDSSTPGKSATDSKKKGSYSLRKGLKILRRTFSDASLPSAPPPKHDVSSSTSSSSSTKISSPKLSSRWKRSATEKDSPVSSADKPSPGALPSAVPSLGNQLRRNTMPELVRSASLDSGGPGGFSALKALPTVSRSRAGSVVGATKKLRSAAKASALGGKAHELREAQQFFHRASTGIVAAESLPKDVRDLTLKNVMAFNSLSIVYGDWLGMQQCRENITFWKSVQGYKQLRGEEALLRALSLYNEYIRPDAPTEINVSASSIRDTENWLRKLNLIAAKPSVARSGSAGGPSSVSSPPPPLVAPKPLATPAEAALNADVTDEQKRNMFKKAQKEVWRNLSDAFPQFAEANAERLDRAMKETQANLVSNYETACSRLLKTASSLAGTGEAGEDVKQLIEVVEQKLNRLKATEKGPPQAPPDPEKINK